MVELLFIQTFFLSHSDSLSDHVDHVVTFRISFKHAIDLGLRYYKLNLAEKIFPHGCISAVETLNGLYIGRDKLIK